MAQGYLQYFAGNRAEIFSAGVAPHGVNPLAVQVMAEDGIDIAHHTSNHVDEYMDLPFDYVITVCDNARQQCPFFPSTARNGEAQRFHQSFTDPGRSAGAVATPGHTPGMDALTSFRLVRDEIRVYSRRFIDCHLADISASHI